ncbi:unnamed protein product [Gadus morhua 'NCC']
MADHSAASDDQTLPSSRGGLWELLRTPSSTSSSSSSSPPTPADIAACFTDLVESDVNLISLPKLRRQSITCCIRRSRGRVDPFSAYRAEPQCWDSSSARLLKMRSPGIADTVPAFWDLMVFLKASDNRKHSALFWDLAQVFWDIYVDCVLARSHGLGRRGLKLPKDRITSVHSLVTDQSFRLNKSQSNFSRLKRSSYAWLSITVRHVGAGVKGHSRTPKITGLSKT